MVDLDSVVKAWAQAFTEEVSDFAQPDIVNDSQVFGDVYHSLIHSPLSMTLLQLEASYAASVESVCRERDLRLSDLDSRHSKQMTETVAAATGDNCPGTVSEQEVNALAVHQVDERELLTSKFESEIDTLHQSQRREFRSWVMTVHAEFKTSNQIPSSVPRSESSFSLSSQPEILTLQESFTITLGAQMKQMHNLRVSAANVLDLLRYSPGDEALPQRLQTSMSLYSNNLCGVVLLTDNRIQAVSGVSGDLSSLVQRSTEFHFPVFGQQLDTVRQDLKKSSQWRQDYWTKKAATDAAYNNGDTTNTNTTKKDFTDLQTGDFYLTRHSNLCETHTIFHMVVDDSLENVNISSRHPVIVGLRNVLKTACLNDVTSLTVPLLLGHAMTEKMTVSWCLRRAELVFKCLKGFMMEMGGWGGSEIKTLQFLLPADIDHDVFLKLTAMLSTIFRVSSAIRG